MKTTIQRNVNSVWDGWSVPYTVIRKPLAMAEQCDETWVRAGNQMVQVRDERGNVLDKETLDVFATEHNDIFDEVN